MSDDGSPRRRTSRRVLLAIARVVALLILVTGINGVLAVALPQLSALLRNGVALAAAVLVDSFLSRAVRRSGPAMEVPGVAPSEDIERLKEAFRDLESQRFEEQERTSTEIAEARQIGQRLQSDLNSARAELDRQRADSEVRVAAITRDREQLVEVNSELRQQIAGFESELAKVRAAQEEEARFRRVDGENARDREARLHEQFQAESKHLEHAAGSALEEIQRTRAAKEELRGELERERAERKRLESQLVELNGRLAVAVEELAGLRTERERNRRELDETRQRAEGEKAALRSSIGAESKAKLDKATADVQQQLQQEQQRFQGELKQLDTQWSAKLQKIVTELATDHENDLGEAIAAREEARAENRNLNGRLHELQKQIEIVREGRLALLQRDDALTQQLESERKLNAELKGRLEAMPAPIDEKSLREKIDQEWSAKLQKIVTGLTTDHENDIGDAIAAREAARAEARSLNLRVQELQQQLHTARDGKLGLLQRDDEVAQQFEAERRLARELSELNAKLEEENAALEAQLQSGQSTLETVLRQKIDSEWSEKLQTIVGHIASDHEADIGKAIEEKEAARAEVRNLSMKVNTLQQKIDSERQAVASVTAKLREAEEEINTLRNAQLAAPFEPPPLLPEPLPLPESPEPEPSNEEEEARARAEVLQFAEQAHEALRRVTSPGDEPLPAEERKSRILFVHHDPAMRTMWRDNLQKSGFDVRTAADGLEGLRLAKGDKPDVVIADASMPKMDGRELCQLIKSNPETTGVKVILMTGVYTYEAPMEAAARELQADELLRKPVKLETLKAALSNLLSARVAS